MIRQTSSIDTDEYANLDHSFLFLYLSFSLWPVSVSSSSFHLWRRTKVWLDRVMRVDCAVDINRCIRLPHSHARSRTHAFFVFSLKSCRK